MPADFFVKVLHPVTGATIVGATPLDVGDLEFTQEVAAIGGDEQLGSFKIMLKDISDPSAEALRLAYQRVKKQMRVQIHRLPTCNDAPAFVGVIRSLTDDLSGQPALVGVGPLGYLEKRKVRRGATLTEPRTGAINIVTAMQNLLKTYNPHSVGGAYQWDSFDSGALGAMWDTSAGKTYGYTVVSDPVLFSINGNRYAQSNITVHTDEPNLYSVSYQAADWADMRVSFDLSLPANRLVNIFVPYFNGVGLTYLRINNKTTASQDPNAAQFALLVTGSNTQIAQRAYNFLSDTFYHFDIITVNLSSGGRRYIVVMNNIEVLNWPDTGGSPAIAGPFRIQGVSGTTGAPDNIGSYRVDNVRVLKNQSVITIGNFTATSRTLAPDSHSFNSDSQLEALNELANLLNYEYRLRYGDGLNADVMDAGLSVGTDWSSTIRFVEGVNLSGLREENSDDGYATDLWTHGQSDDEASANFIATNPDVLSDTPIIEDDYGDDRVIDASIGRIIGAARLNRLTQGHISLTGKVYDPDDRYKDLFAGDYVWVKSLRLNIDGKKRVVGLTRRKGDANFDVTFDYHPLRIDRRFRRELRKIARQVRRINRRIDTQTFNLTYNLGKKLSTVSQSVPFYVRGQVRAFEIDVIPYVGANIPNPTAMTLTLDGVPITPTPAPVLTFHVTLTAAAYPTLVLSGDHKLTLAVTGKGGSGGDDIAVTIDFQAKVVA